MKRLPRTLLLALACCAFFTTIAGAQAIRGQITDTAGRPIENASIFVRESMSGTVANMQGYYELKAAPGTYTCTFQCLGYETKTETVTVGTDTTEHNVRLQDRAYDIGAVTVTSKGEDRAYRIMRMAIASAPYYLNQVSEYSADVYLKGSLQPVKISRLVRGLAGDAIDDYKVGSTYVEESFNEIGFTAPNKYTQKVTRQISSMPEGGGDGAMRLVNISIYDPEALPLIISPLSPGAFSHYRFRYEGYVEEGDRIINKIRVTPLRTSQQLVSGHIYIAENHWNVHDLDLSGRMNLVMGIGFRLQVDFGEVSRDVWMPVSHRITFDASLLGSKGVMQYVSSVKYNRIALNTSLRKPDAISPDARDGQQDKLSNRGSYRLARQIGRENDAPKRKSLDITESFSDNYRVTVDSIAREPDPAFWDSMRPVPLNPDELKGYGEKSVAATQIKDTTATSRRGKSLFSTVLTGRKDLRFGKHGGALSYRGLIPSQLGFNTVDGFFVGLAPLSYGKSFSASGGTALEISPEVAWAINRRAVMWNVDASLAYAPMHRGTFDIRFGSLSRDYNSAQGILPVENTIASLFFRRNYQKLYEDNFAEATNTIDIANGLVLQAAFKYSRRRMPGNTSDYSFFYRDSREYTPNVPRNPELTADPADHTAAVFSLGAEYTPRYYYRMQGGRKQMVRSAWPAFFASWQKGVKGVAGSVTDFDHISGGVRQNILIGGPFQRLGYFVRGGVFVNRKSVFFPDFRHFSTVEIPLANSPIISGNSFNLLEYYRYSTSQRYLEAHVSYQARFLVLKLLPWFSGRLWQEGLQFNYLTTPILKNYMELGYTVGLMWQAGVFVGFENFRYRSFGVKLSIPVRIETKSRSIQLSL